MLAAPAARLAPDFKASKRGPITAGAGHFVVGDATVGGIKVRIGGLAVVAAGIISPGIQTRSGCTRPSSALTTLASTRGPTPAF